MKNKLLLLFSLFLIANNSDAQTTFQRAIHTKGSSTAYAVEQTNDGGYIIAGVVNNVGTTNNDVYLVKTNLFGDTVWTKTFGGTNFEIANAVQQTSDSGYIVAGSTSSFGQGGDIYIIKTNAVGDTLWTKTYGGTGAEYGYSIQQTYDGGYIIAGSSSTYGILGSLDVYLIKINAAGDITWTSTYGGASNEEGTSVRQTSDSGYIVCGYTFSFGDGAADFYLIKTDAAGDTLWTKTYGGLINEAAYAVQQTRDGGYIVAGYSNSFGAGSYDFYVVKTDAAGDTLWTKTYGGDNDDEANAIQQTSDGGYIIGGYTLSFGAGNYDDYLIKTDSSGNMLWSKTYGGTAIDGCYSASQTADGGYILAGNAYSFYAGQDSNEVYLVKTDASGNSGCKQGNPNTVVASTRTVVQGTETSIHTGGTASFTSTIVSSGGNDSTLCLATGIVEQSINNTISVYPNPATDQLFINGDWKTSGSYELRIFDILGETIYTEEINSKMETINCKAFPSGVYFLRVANEEEVWLGRFVKE